MRVLSLFDGMSCGHVALERVGITPETYYASEIDKYAIQISKKNWPDIIQLGDVTKWREWDIDFSKIDLLLAGFPCQAWSMAGKQKGDNDPRGALVHDLIDIWREIKTHNQEVYFLFENVKMKKEFLENVNNLFGVEPILINSALVSAQNRNRYYWTNIECVEQPNDKGILLKNIVLDDVLPVSLDGLRGSNGQFGEGSVRVSKSKSPTLRTPSGGGNIPSFHLKNLIHSKQAIEYMNRKTKDGRTHWDFEHHSDIRDDKSATVVANFFKGVPYNVFRDCNVVRKFHPIECERLQTLDDNYTQGVSNTQRYKMIGNGWTVDVIAHIMKGLK